MESFEVWRYEAPEGVFHWVSRDPARIKRPGTRYIALLAEDVERLASLAGVTIETEEKPDA